MIAQLYLVYFSSPRLAMGRWHRRGLRLSRFLWGNAGFSIFQELRARFVLLEAEVLKPILALRMRIRVHAKKRRGSLYLVV